MNKAFLELKSQISKSQKVEKCFILYVAGKNFTDNREINIPCRDSKIFGQLMDHPSPLVINDSSNDKVLIKEIQMYFNIAVKNMMIVPIIRKRSN